MRTMERTWFEVLGVPETADSAAIKHAWRSRLTVVHPDHGGTRAQFDEVQEAYRILADHSSRVEYLRRLHVEDTPPDRGTVPPSSGTQYRTPASEQFPDMAPASTWAKLWAVWARSAPASMLIACAWVAAGMLAATSGVGRNLALTLGASLSGTFSAWMWWVGSAFLLTFWCQVMVLARRSASRRILTLAVGLAAALTELVLPYLGFTSAAAVMLFVALTPSLLILAAWGVTRLASMVAPTFRARSAR